MGRLRSNYPAQSSIQRELRRRCGAAVAARAASHYIGTRRPVRHPPPPHPHQESSAGPQRAPPLSLSRMCFPSIHPSIPPSLHLYLHLSFLCSRFQRRWIEALQSRGSRGRESEREGAGGSAPPPLLSSAVCGVLCLRLGGRLGADGSLKLIPGVLSHPSPRPSLLRRVGLYPDPHPHPHQASFSFFFFCFLFFGALLHPDDSGQQFALWNLFDSHRSSRVLRTYLWICFTRGALIRSSEVDPRRRLLGSNWRWKRWLCCFIPSGYCNATP